MRLSFLLAALLCVRCPASGDGGKPCSYPCTLSIRAGSSLVSALLTRPL